MTALEEIIRTEIGARGAMRFDRFMELALYHPAHGYYSFAEIRPQIGRAGDFFTSVSVGPLFGRLLAKQFFQVWKSMGRPAWFWIVEQGAHDGRFAVDVLEWCQEEAPEFFEVVQYGIVEPAGKARTIQQARAEISGVSSKIEWFENLERLAREKPSGIFFSNELVDAFPVRVVTFRAGAWRERKVALYGEEGFAWVEEPITDEELLRAAAALPGIEGYTTEINLQARSWMAEVARTLARGYIMTIDYGFPASVYYAPFRAAGTLTARAQHETCAEVWAEPGHSDITAHVDFTALAKAGEEAGWTTIGFPDQQRFLMGIAHDELSGVDGPRVGLPENLRAWNTLTHPGHLGLRFQVLLQAKNVSPKIDGLRFSRPAELEELQRGLGESGDKV